MIFSVLSLLIVVAIVGLIAKHQLRAVSGAGVGARIDSAASAAGVVSPLAPADGGGQTVPQQARNVEQQFKDATHRALQQGANRASDPSE